MKKLIRKIIIALGLAGLAGPPVFAYTAYPWLNGGATNGGLTSGSLIGYTVLGSDGTTVIAGRATTGIVEIGGGTYVIANGISVPDGSAYIIKWDRSDSSTQLGAAPTVPNSYLGTIKASTASLTYDGSGYVKSDNQTNVTLASGQNVATIGGQAPPTNWSTTSISGSGVVSANATQFGGQATVLDGNNLPKVAATDWAGSLITTAQPNTAAVTVAGYASNQDPGYLVGTRTVDGSVTFDGSLAALLANLLGPSSNSFNSTTHVLTTTYTRQNGSTTAYTNSTTYNGSTTPPVQSRTGAVGTLPN